MEQYESHDYSIVKVVYGLFCASRDFRLISWERVRKHVKLDNMDRNQNFRVFEIGSLPKYTWSRIGMTKKTSLTNQCTKVFRNLEGAQSSMSAPSGLKKIEVGRIRPHVMK